MTGCDSVWFCRTVSFELVQLSRCRSSVEDSLGSVYRGSSSDAVRCVDVPNLSRVRGFIEERNPTRLILQDAESLPSGSIRRVRYVSADRAAESGVVAFPRALEHINFAWCFWGSLLRLPVIHQTAPSSSRTLPGSAHAPCGQVVQQTLGIHRLTGSDRSSCRFLAGAIRLRPLGLEFEPARNDIIEPRRSHQC